MTCVLPELLMPAGDLSKLQVALEYGADAVYVGAAGFSMRPDGASFTPERLSEGVAMAHRYGKKLYVGVNSMILEEELPVLEEWVEQTRHIPMDAVIVADLAAFSVMRDKRPEVPIHISTQAGASNSTAARFWKNAGAERVILARECTLADARSIVQSGDIEVEVFVHGAMCVAVSGRCLLSAYMIGQSANKGECKHSCRWDYQLVERKRPGHEYGVFETGKETIIMGSTDLCLLEHIPELVKSGVVSLKVEGRMKNEHYVAVVTNVYRAALDAYAADPQGYVFDPSWLKELDAINHRPYATGFAFGYPFTEPDTLQVDYSPSGTHLIAGKVTGQEGERYKIHTKHPVYEGDTLDWMGPGMTRGRVRVIDIVDGENEPAKRVVAAEDVTMTFETQDGPLPTAAILRKEKTTPTGDMRRDRSDAAPAYGR